MSSEFAHFMLVDFESYTAQQDIAKSEIIEVTWLVYEVEQRVVTHEASFPVRPELVSIKDAAAQTGVCEEKLESGCLLADAVQQFDSQILEKFQITRKPITIICFGKSKIGDVLRTDAKQKGISLYSHYNHYIDITDVLRDNYPDLNNNDLSSVLTTAQKLDVPVIGSCKTGLDRCHTIAGIVTRLLQDEVQIGKEEATPTTISKVRDSRSDSSSKSCNAVRLSGLPWDVTVPQIVAFFAPICRTLSSDVHITTGHAGRPTGEAYVTLSSVEHRDAAIRDLHGKCVGQRWVDVFKSSAEELNRYLFDRRLPTSDGPSTNDAVLRLRGVPYTSNEAAIVSFFAASGVKVEVDQVVMEYTQDNRLTGNAWVSLESPQACEAARKKLHRRNIEHRYIEVFSSTRSEMENARNSRFGRTSSFVFRHQKHSQQQQPCAEFGFTVLRMRGLPYSSNENSIVDFFKRYHMAAILPATALIDGKPSGEAYVQFANPSEAWRAYTEKQGDCIGCRYVELFAVSKHEMDLAAAGMDPRTIRQRTGRPY